MKLSFTAILFTLILNMSYTQNKVIWTKEEKGDKLPKFAVVNKKGELITVDVKFTDTKIRKLKVKKYDKNLNLLSKVEQSEWESKSWKVKEYYLNDVVVLNDKIYFILFKKDGKDYTVFINELNESLKASDKIVQIAEFKNIKMSFAKLMALQGFVKNKVGFNHKESFDKYINVKISKDRQKIVLYNFTHYDKEKHAIMYCYDKDFNLLWDKDINLRLKNNDIEIENVVLSNTGNVYINYEKTISRNLFGGGVFETYVLQISDKGSKVRVLELEPDEEVHLEDVIIDDNEYTGSLNALGFYSNKKIRHRLNGVVNFVIDENTLKVKTKNVSPFTLNEYKEFFKEKKAERFSEKDKGLGNNFFVIGTFAMSDGGTVYVAEQFTWIENIDSRGRKYYTYLFEDILIIKTNMKGEYEWTKMLFRKQGPYSYQVLPFMGSYTFCINDKIYLVYNDSERNLEHQQKVESGEKNKNTAKSSVNMKRAMAVMKKIDTDGNIETEILLNGKEEDVIFSTLQSKKLSSNQFLFFANKNKLTKLGLFSPELKKLEYKPKFEISNDTLKPNTNKVENSDIKNNSDIINENYNNSKVESKKTTSSPTNTTPEVKTPPAEAPKPVYTPSSVSPGRKATDSELDFFNKLREQQPAAEPAK